jgi:hypothetical protein
VEAKLKYADDLRKALEVERGQLAASRRQLEAERQRLAGERAKKSAAGAGLLGAVPAVAAVGLPAGGVAGLLPQAAAAVPAPLAGR